MDVKLKRLTEATQSAILGNTEEIQMMNSEMQEVQKEHTAFFLEQKQTLGSIQEDTGHIRTVMDQVLAIVSTQKKESGGDRKRNAPADQGKHPSAARIRSLLPQVEGEAHEYDILKETLVHDTCSWVFSEPEWAEWLNHGDESEDNRPILVITGEQGMGKSHIAATVSDKLHEMAMNDESKHTCAAHFYFREQSTSLSTFLNAIVTVINQVAEKNAALCEKINAEYQKDDVIINNFYDWKEVFEKLLAPCFIQKSKYRLQLLLDGVDELEEDESKFLRQFLEIVKEQRLNISVALTMRTSTLESVSGIIPVVHLEVTKEKQKEDMKSFIWSRVNNLSPLKTFSGYVKQSVADKAEKESPSRCLSLCEERYQPS